MTPEQLDNILNQIKNKMLDVDPETGDQMDLAMAALEEWRNEDGFAGEMPYLQDLQAWGIVMPDMAPVAEESIDESTEAVDSPVPPEPDEVPTPSSHPLQQAYDNANAYLENERYYAARQAFAALREQAEGEWLIKAEDSYREAREKLVRQTRPLIEQAETFAKDNPDDLPGQRNQWDEVLEVDRDNTTAKQALSQLQQQGGLQESETKIADYRQDLTEALQKRNLPLLNQVLGDVTSLQINNQIQDLQYDLDALVQEINRERERLRDQLGAASTLAVSGNQKEAYKQAQAYLDEGVETVIDASGELFDGEAGAEIEPYRFYRKARSIFLDSLKELAQQRQDLADGQKGENPALALDTLQDAMRHLIGQNEQGEDEGILQKEDRDELEPTLILIQRAIQEINLRLLQFDEARDKVLEAQEPGARPERQLQLYREAREIYAEYPEIDTYIEAAQDAQASVEAGRLLDQMTVARRYSGEDEFAEAIDVLQAAREEVIAHIPHPKPNSDLQKRLDEIRNLEQTILDAERDHKRMMTVLQKVDDLLQTYAENKSSDLLVAARNRLNQLTEQEEKHHEARERRTRLIDQQSEEESWQQGQEAYRLGEWARAIELLQRVAESEDAEEKQEATLFIQRARAAEHVINARQEEDARNWRAALNKYGEAQRLFNQDGADDQTDHLRQECTQALNRLKPIEAHDKTVSRVINQAQDRLKSAAEKVAVRRSLLDKVEPIQQYQQAVDALLKVREQDTTLTDKLEGTLRDARNQWRDTYLSGMRQARHSKDESILEKAVQLGNALDEQGLLYETDDKQTYQAVQERYLELQYEQLKSEPTTDPTFIEENRRRRLEMATVKTDDLRSQYREAIEQRVLSQMSEKRREQGKGAAYALLQEEILKPELYQSEKLLVEYMHLCWELEDWGEAQRQAESLEFRAHLTNARAKSDMWQGLTEAASLLNEGDLAASRAEISQMEARIQGNDPQLSATLSLEERWQKAWRVDRLLTMAKEAAREDRDEKNIEAAQLYAQAFQLKPTDIRVKNGLKQIGGRLDANLRAYAQQAQNIRIKRPLGENIKTAKGLENILEALLNVADALSLEQDTQEELQEGLEHLQKRLQPWQTIKAKIDQAQREVADALAYPEPLQRDGDGGWQFGEIAKQIDDARKLTTQRDREILKLLTDEKEPITILDEQAQELNEAVRALMQAVQDEEFDAVLSFVNSLETLWNSYSVAGFQGLELLIRHRYAFLKREVSRLVEHKKQAQLQKGNLDEWQDWANQVAHHYRDARGKAGQLNKPLDDLREDKQLSEIARLCREVIEESNEFEDALEMQPETLPLSARAAQEQARVTAAWKTDVFGSRSSYRDKVHELLDHVHADSEDLKERLRKLKGALRQLEAAADRVGKKAGGLFGKRITSVPKSRFRLARQALRECEALDPNHDDVLDAGERIRDWERKYQEDGGE